MGTRAACSDRQDPVGAAVHDQHRDVDLWQVGPEVGMPRRHAGDGPGRGCADRRVPGVPDGFGADPAAERLIEVIEVLVPLGEVGEPVGGQRRLDLIENLLRDAVGRLGSLQQVRRDAGHDSGPADPLGAVAAQVAGDLTAAHRMPGYVEAMQVERGHERVQIGGEVVVVIAGGGLAGFAEPAPVIGDDPVPIGDQGPFLPLPGPAAQREAVDEHDRPARAVILVVQLDRRRILPAGGHKRHHSSFRPVAAAATTSTQRTVCICGARRICHMTAFRDELGARDGHLTDVPRA
jgi:hypothetical protein